MESESINLEVAKLEFLNIIQHCFKNHGDNLQESATKIQKKDSRAEFLDRVTPQCVAYLEKSNFDTSGISQFFEIPYAELKFDKLTKEFKAMHTFEYTPKMSPSPPEAILCRILMSALNNFALGEKETQENIKNVAIAITDLFLSINTFVLYHVADEELAIPSHSSKKNQSPVQVINNRIIDKMNQLGSHKVQHDMIKQSCQMSPTLLLKLIELVELRRTVCDQYFLRQNLDKFVLRNEFSPITSIGNIRDIDKLYYWESEPKNSINFSTIPLACSTSSGPRKFRVQIATIDNVPHIFDLLEIEEYDGDLMNKTWLERLDYFKLCKTQNTRTSRSSNQNQLQLASLITRYKTTYQNISLLKVSGLVLISRILVHPN